MKNIVNFSEENIDSKSRENKRGFHFLLGISLFYTYLASRNSLQQKSLASTKFFLRPNRLKVVKFYCMTGYLLHMLHPP